MSTQIRRKNMGHGKYQNLLAVAILLSVLYLEVHGSHFRGGTISWKPEGGTEVHFYFKLGWAYGRGPGCSRSLIGKFVSGMSSDYWSCASGNCGKTDLSNVNYFCTGADKAQDWEQGKGDFNYSFPNTGPFTVGYASQAWIDLSNGRGNGPWNVATTIDLRKRSDTGSPNSSPESQSKPIYYVPFNCEVNIKLPVIDPDNDMVRCRWATGSECESVCHALPAAELDEQTCTLSFNTTASNGYILTGIYAVALTIEDHPRIPTTIGGKMKLNPSDVLSTIPLQFLVQTIDQPCGAGPRFVTPTPEEGDVITVEEGEKLQVGLYTDNRNDTSGKANDITAAGPIDITLSPVILDAHRVHTYTTTMTWQTHHKDIGSHIVCAHADNNIGGAGAQRCFTIDVVPNGCSLSPCQNQGKCKSSNYMCACRPGFTGQDCEVNIDDCVANTCPDGTYCLDGINTHTCHKNSTCTC